MTTIGGRDPWDDDRLAAAFRARAADVATPELLVDTAVDQLRRTSNMGKTWPALRPVFAVIAIAAIAVSSLVALATYQNPGYLALPDEGGSSPLPTKASAAPSPEALSDLPIISVVDAIAIRDAGVDDRELAVRGWITLVYPVLSCPVTLPPVIFPVQLICPDNLIWLTQDPEATVKLDGGISFEPPKGPAFNPALRQIDMRSWPPQPNPRSCGTRAGCTVKPVSVIAIGHFDDRRAALCVPRVAEQCHDRFIVDRIDSLGGVEQPLSIVDYSRLDHVWPVDDIERLVGNRTVLSISFVDGTDGLPQLEPSLRDNGTWSREKAIWVIRTLVDGRVATNLVIDGSERVFEMRADGSATLVR